MSFKHSVFAAVAVAVLASPAFASSECPIKDAGPKAEWQTKESLEKKLVDAGWKVRRIKIDGQCFEVYGTDDKGKRVEAYFNPKTLEPARS
jgi:hypothetical protein